MWHTWWILLTTISSESLLRKNCMRYLTCTRTFFFSGNVPNYSPTIHPPWRISFAAEVVNVRLNTNAPVQYQAWSTGARMYNVWVLTIYCRLYNIKWQILMSLKMYYLGQTEENDDNSVRIASILAKWKGAKVNWMFTASVMKMNIQPPTSSVL